MPKAYDSGYKLQKKGIRCLSILVYAVCGGQRRKNAWVTEWNRSKTKIKGGKFTFDERTETTSFRTGGLVGVWEMHSGQAFVFPRLLLYFVS